MRLKTIRNITILLILFLTLLFSASFAWIYFSTKKLIYSNISDLPYNKVGLIPGCNKYVSNGNINYYFVERISSGALLYHKNKIEYILVSGDNALASYDEPREMINSLIEAGVPKSKIVADYAGFRTLDTVIRAKEVFQLDKVTFISQNFQNQRGVFIGLNKGMDIIAYDVEPISLKYGYKTEIRELFAKIKMLLDLYILDKEPKFLGDIITIGQDNN
ncbi:MAG: hypothetical protein B6229_08950 [Spirochaetaceae bacterium 4572_7]|nr:MAG: hypothetical protein B6229_08950 [Spirochaetaceae bacterium 4572_7]